MERMNLRQFKKYCDSKQFREITLHHENQEWEVVDNPLKYQLSFRNIMVSVAPDVGCVCLGDGGSLVYMQPVRYVLVDEKRTPIGTIAHVVCGDSRNKYNSIQYTIIML